MVIHMFKKLLIANRGEIAVRIIRACRELGVRTVAVYSEADSEALHTQMADEAVCIGPMMSKDSYLKMERILSATLASGAEAIHPGFGFLSENSRFSNLCKQCNITFIGPSGKVIEQMGDKSKARITMEEAGVPVIPGSKEPIRNAIEGKQLAEKIGYPVIIKASAGGGGRGMRIARNSKEFQGLFDMAKQEAMSAFGDSTMYIEKYLEGARHIEFQILGDRYGNIIHLGERDCSIQRRHQKMIEEAPSSVISESLRKEMGEAAVRAAKAVSYENAGTVEFLLDKDGKYYFMEMNTRIQVEHGITELVTGVDLVKEQIKIAAGEPLMLTQEDIRIQGHAIECRINAECPEKNFLPCPGTVTDLRIPGGNGVRVDTALYHGYHIPSVYDSLIAKVMVHDGNREETIRKMEGALGELIIDGIDTNTDFLYRILHHPDFISGNVDTDFLNQLFSRS